MIFPALLLIGMPATGDELALGAGSIAAEPPAGAKQPPETIYRTDGDQRPMPTNDWWSSIAWLQFSERHYAHPLAMRAEPGGLRVYYPGWNITANEHAIFGFMPHEGGADLVLGHSEVEEFPDARVADWSDWFVDVQFGGESAGMRLSYGHGSPYVYARYTGGAAKLTFAETPKLIHGDESSASIAVAIGQRRYGLFAPGGSTWQGIGTNTLTVQSDKPHFSLAILPDDTTATFDLFASHAHAHVTGSEVAWTYDEAKSVVATRFRFTLENMEGDADSTLTALYPHQWRRTNAELTGHTYASVRGTMKLARGSEFQTIHPFPGLLPVLPNTGGVDRQRMLSLLAAEAAREPERPKDTYWEGKWLGRTATLANIAGQYGDQESADEFLGRLRERLEDWFSATRNGQPKQTTLFAYEPRWGTLIGYPGSFGSDNDLNDHHFHYGYFIRAAAEVALRDPAWGSGEQYGKVVEHLTRDIASPAANDPRYPRLRNFDPYAGHSWASGHAKFGDGNNNESSSEAMNAWAGVILWGEATGDRATRDLGVYLYATELQAIEEYWFDVHGENHPADYPISVATMIWGGKCANGTWFTGNPEMVHGINWLPFHGGSTYLGRFPKYVAENYADLKRKNGDEPFDAWVDLVWMYRALSDPADAARQMEARWDDAPREGGNSRANTLHWVGSVGKLGRVDRTVTADYPYYGVFRREGQRTYVAYSFDGEKRMVTFSDGFTLNVEEKGFAVRSRP